MFRISRGDSSFQLRNFVTLIKLYFNLYYFHFSSKENELLESRAEIAFKFIQYHSPDYAALGLQVDKGDFATLGLHVDEVGAQVVLSKVSIYYPSDSLSMVTIHRNDTNQQHAETKLLQLLRGISENAREIDIGIIQNFSPCNDEANGQLCAQGIANYKNLIKCQPTKIDISITFANFYRTIVYDENDENRAEQNRRGLRLLYDNGVQLQLLCGQEG